jgi:hypothetical protein
MRVALYARLSTTNAGGAVSKFSEELVGAIGFEPTTPCAQGRCATRLRYAPTEVAELILKYFPTSFYPATMIFA